jgi:hypothetical protein
MGTVPIFAANAAKMGLSPSGLTHAVRLESLTYGCLTGSAGCG